MTVNPVQMLALIAEEKHRRIDLRKCRLIYNFYSPLAATKKKDKN